MKKIISISIIAVIAISGYVGRSYNKTHGALDMTLTECEALAGCEVYNSQGEVIVSCEGDSGVCYEMGNLYCPGKKKNS